MNFYQNISPFSDFTLLAESEFFFRVPDNWYVVISDIRGSTKAIQEGRYKEVNLVGAASISCVTNALGTQDIPFVFGGDGSTMVIAEEQLPKVIESLIDLQNFSKKEFQLELRVGIVSMKRLRELGTDLCVGKYQLSPGNYTAQFKGGALAMAEEMIKKGSPEGANLLSSSGKEGAPFLEGLSCRLQPLKARNGVILSILIKPLGPVENHDLIIKSVLQDLRAILNGDLLSARPVHTASLAWRWPHSTIKSEFKTQRGSNSSWKTWLLVSLRTLVAAISLNLNIPLGPFKPRVYKTELLSNSDFKKFDEVLRMVMDCDPEQERAIEALLLQLSKERKISFGVHKSKNALMTCMVRSASANQHIHFIDGDKGGYAMAAVQLKKSLG